MTRRALTGALAGALAWALIGCGATTYQGLPIVVRSVIVPCPMTQYSGIAWSPDGALIAVSAAIDGYNYHIHVIKPEGGAFRQMSEWIDPRDNIQWSPDSHWLAYTLVGKPTIVGVTVSSVDGKETRLIPDATGFSWSPDSQFIAYSAYTSGFSGIEDIYVTRLDGSNVIALTDDPLPDARPAWSPDGEWIAYYQADRAYNIFLVRPDGSQTKQLTFAGHNTLPHWSPDGSKVGYYSTRNGQIEIHAISADGADERVISSHDRNGEYLWLPDSQHIALAAIDNSGDAYLTIVDIDTLAEERLTTLAIISSANPAFTVSPDGKRVAFIDLDHSNPNVAAPEIYVINRDGSGLTRLTDNPGKRYCVNWPF